MFWPKSSKETVNVRRSNSTEIPSRRISDIPSNRSSSTSNIDSKSSSLVIDGHRYCNSIIESTAGLSKIVFFQIINKKVKVPPHLFSHIAVAQLNASSKECVLFLVKDRASQDDIATVLQLMSNQGFELNNNGTQIYHTISTLVIALSQGQLDDSSLAVEREISRNAPKSSLMTAFIDIITWAYINKADDIDFAIDVA